MSYTAVGQTASFRDVQTSSYTSTPPTTQIPKCATAAEKRQAEIDCINASLRGLGSVYPSGSKFAGLDPCQVQNLATCPTSLVSAPSLSLLQPAPAPVTTYAAPTPPPQEPIGPPKMSAVQQPTTATSTAPFVPAAAPPPVPVTDMAPPPVDRSNLIIGGIVAAVVVAGGYIVYRTTKRR